MKKGMEKNEEQEIETEKGKATKMELQTQNEEEEERRRRTYGTDEQSTYATPDGDDGNLTRVHGGDHRVHSASVGSLYTTNEDMTLSTTKFIIMTLHLLVLLKIVERVIVLYNYSVVVYLL